MTNLDLFQPVTPLVGIPIWSERLRQISTHPLEYCPDFPTIARRFDAWWAHDMLDRPVFMARVNTRPERPVTRRMNLLHDPELWFRAKRRDMEQIRCVGDAIPYLRVEMPVLSGMMRADVAYNIETDTAWTSPTINDDWSNLPAWRWRDDDAQLNLMRKLTRLVSKDAAGRYLVMTGGVGMGGDALQGMRGSKELCIDLIEQPEKVRSAIDAYYPLWVRLLGEFYEIATSEGAGIIQNVGVWSCRPYITPQCDFSFMIGPRHFQDIFLPEIARQAATVARAAFHLDGPGVANHIDAILQIPDIQAIQWVPGAGMESTLSYVPMLQMIQRRGRSLQVVCPADDVLPICDALRPEGLCLSVSHSLSPDQLDDLYTAFCRRYGMQAVGASIVGNVSGGDI